MVDAFLVDTVDKTIGCCRLVVQHFTLFSELHDQLASLESHEQLTCCFSTVAEHCINY